MKKHDFTKIQSLDAVGVENPSGRICYNCGVAYKRDIEENCSLLLTKEAYLNCAGPVFDDEGKEVG